MLKSPFDFGSICRLAHRKEPLLALLVLALVSRKSATGACRLASIGELSATRAVAPNASISIGATRGALTSLPLCSIV